jgi:hypothetical protein
MNAGIECQDVNSWLTKKGASSTNDDPFHSCAFVLFHSTESRSKPGTVFQRAEEGLDHFSLQEVAVELVQLVQPEVIAVEVVVRRRVRIPAQVAEVLHLHETPGHLEPGGMLTTTSSPSSLPIRLQPVGETVEINPGAGSLFFRRH